MKKHITEILSIFMIAVLLVFSSLSFVSAAALIDESKTVSITLNCDKQGYEFTVYKVGTLDSTAESPYETKYNSLVPQISSSVLSGDTEGILKVLDNLDELPSTAPAVAAFTVSSASTTKTVSGLAQGIYYIKATNYPAGVKAVTNSVVALPYYDSGWVYSINDIELAEKVVDDVPETHKTITNSTKNNENYTDVSLGDTVDFEIRSTTAGSSAMRLGSYAVYDDMSAGLTLDKNSFNVALLKNDGTKITDLDESEYTVTVTSEGEGENTLFNVALTHDYLQADEFYASDVYYTSVTYSAVLNQYAIVGTAGNPNSEQKLVYSNKNGVTDEVEANTVYVYTYAAKVNKLNPDGETLQGAEFGLYKTEADAKAKENEIAVGVSDSNGEVLFYNSKNEEMKLQSGTYYIFETAAPKGYNLYGKVIEITIEAEYGDTFINGTYVTNCPKDGYASIDVTDTPIILPQTGGYGTIIFYVLGACCFAGAVTLFLIAHKKKKSKS